MFELTDTRPNLEVQESEYRRLLGYPADHVLEGRARELADQTRQWFAANGRPWIYAREVDGLALADERLRINGTELVSRPLHDQFAAARADGVMLAVVSAGKECEEQAARLWQEGKPDEYFFMEMYGSAVVEHLITVTGGRICAWAEQQGRSVLPHYSPGYSGWDVADQNKLWQLIRANGVEFPGRLQVLDTGMLRPKKSLLGLFGITRHRDRVQHLRDLVPCHNCALNPCQYRRAPYRYSLLQAESARRGEGDQSIVAGPKATNGHALNRNASYSLNGRALRKWSEQRLQLTILPDGSIEARFRYEGTTCLNLGRPLEFDYHVQLSRPEGGYRILGSACVPAPGDTGHASQCEYLNNADSLMRSIATEKPLLGKPLNDVLAWERPYCPSGCYCDADRRAHKWGLVLEVIHFALVQREREQPGPASEIISINQ